MAEPIVGERGLVVAGHADEAAAGLAMLQGDGNAVDAVVAAAFVGFVVEPAACGIGGYGRLALWQGQSNEFVTVDHYVCAPAAARPDMFAIDAEKPFKYYGFPQTVGLRAERGSLSPAVPGAVAGLAAAHGMFGRLPWAQLLEPAIDAARRGLRVTASLRGLILDRIDELRQFPTAAEMFLPGGTLPAEGTRLDRQELAETLVTIAAQGAAGFYGGSIAAAIERTCRTQGGILTAADLAAYRPRILREPAGRYRGLDYVTAFDQVGSEALNILNAFELSRLGSDSVAFRHLMAEALGHAFTDSITHYGDPEHVRSPCEGLASPEFAATRAAAFRLDRAAPRPIVAGDPWPFDGSPAPDDRPTEPSPARISGTSQMAAADGDGNLVALCTSITGAFGSYVAVPGTGILLNNAMQNYDPRPGLPNSIAPGKMPIFAAPTLVAAANGRPAYAACGSGGYRIASGVLHALVHAEDFGMSAPDAVAAPRVHCQGQETYVDSRIPLSVREDLAAMGHDVVMQDAAGPVHMLGNFGRVALIRIDRRTGMMEASHGPSGRTAAAAF